MLSFWQDIVECGNCWIFLAIKCESFPLTIGGKRWLFERIWQDSLFSWDVEIFQWIFLHFLFSCGWWNCGEIGGIVLGWKKHVAENSDTTSKLNGFFRYHIGKDALFPMYYRKKSFSLDVVSEFSTMCFFRYPNGN